MDNFRPSRFMASAIVSVKQKHILSTTLYFAMARQNTLRFPEVQNSLRLSLSQGRLLTSVVGMVSATFRDLETGRSG